jgi:hypothetical protein
VLIVVEVVGFLMVAVTSILTQGTIVLLVTNNPPVVAQPKPILIHHIATREVFVVFLTPTLVTQYSQHQEDQHHGIVSTRMEQKPVPRHRILHQRLLVVPLMVMYSLPQTQVGHLIHNVVQERLVTPPSLLPGDQRHGHVVVEHYVVRHEMLHQLTVHVEQHTTPVIQETQSVM